MGPEVNAQSSEGCRAGLLWGITEDIAFPGYLEVQKTSRTYDRLQLCFQQSAGDSTGPQVDVILCLLRHRLLNQYIPDLYPAAWLEYSVHFPKDG